MEKHLEVYATVGKSDERKERYSANIEVYQNTQEMLHDLSSRSITDSSFQNMQKEHLETEWHGVKKYNEALKLLQNGYTPVVEQIKKELHLYNSRQCAGIQKRFSFSNEVQGFQPIVPLAMQNIPNSMVNSSIRRIKTKIIDIYYDMTISASVTIESAISSGILLLKEISNMEKLGYRINLYSIQVYGDEKGSDILCLKIKNSDTAWDIKRMSFPLCHPTFFRVLGFDWHSRYPDGKYRVGYGKSIYFLMTESNAQALIKQLFNKNAVYVSAMSVIEEGESYLERVFI